jgi:GxxExxY protein
MGEDDPLTREVIGASIEVHRELGPGLLEAVYEACLSQELSDRGIEHFRQVPLSVTYKGHALAVNFVIDILVPGRLIIELKAVETILGVHKAQALTYLRLSKVPVGLLINFNVAVLKDGIKRLVL